MKLKTFTILAAQICFSAAQAETVSSKNTEYFIQIDLPDLVSKTLVSLKRPDDVVKSAKCTVVANVPDLSDRPFKSPLNAIRCEVDAKSADPNFILINQSFDISLKNTWVEQFGNVTQPGGIKLTGGFADELFEKMDSTYKDESKILYRSIGCDPGTMDECRENIGMLSKEAVAFERAEQAQAIFCVRKSEWTTGFRQLMQNSNLDTDPLLGNVEEKKTIESELSRGQRIITDQFCIFHVIY